MVKCDVCPSGDPTSIALDTWGDEAIYEGLYNLRALGYRTIAYWGSVHGEGVIYGDHGEVLGVKEEYLANIDRFLNLCKRADMTVMWVVSAHSDSIVELGEGGEALLDNLRIFEVGTGETVEDSYEEPPVEPDEPVKPEDPDKPSPDTGVGTVGTMMALGLVPTSALTAYLMRRKRK